MKKTWLITGCSSGIGKGIAKAVLAKGDNAVVTARNIDKVADVVDQYPDTAFAVALDVTSAESIDNAVQAALDHFGAIDVLINNAGYGYRAAVEEGEIEMVSELFQTNLFGPIELIKKVIPGMRDRKNGIIANVTSMAAVKVNAGNAYYASSKAALEALTNGLYLELDPMGIKVVTIAPGVLKTSIFANLKGTRNKMSVYEDTVGKMRPENLAASKIGRGDPDKAGQVIVETLELDDPPKKLLLGSDAVKVVVTELTNQIREIAKWAPVSVKTDF